MRRLLLFCLLAAASEQLDLGEYEAKKGLEFRLECKSGPNPPPSSLPSPHIVKEQWEFRQLARPSEEKRQQFERGKKRKDLLYY